LWLLAVFLTGESCGDTSALRAIQRIKALEAASGATRLLFHDPVAIQAMRLCPDCYR
jgi:N-acyl homoserine lactone hydrolase